MVERLKVWVIASLAASAALLLGLGFLLTWAELHTEHLPSLSVLSALPNGFFINVALQTALVPLGMFVLVGVPWIALSIRRYELRRAPYAIWWWGLVGAGLVLLDWLFGIRSSAAQDRSSTEYWIWEGGVIAACLVLAVLVGLAANRIVRGSDREGSAKSSGATSVSGPEPPPAEQARDSPVSPSAREPSKWGVVGPLIAAIAFLSIFTTGSLEIADTLNTKGVLPVAQIVVSSACTDISDGKSPYPGQGALTASHCLIGGFYIGEGSTFVYIVKSANSCPGQQADARLVELPRDQIDEMVILGSCPRRPHRCGEC